MYPLASLCFTAVAAISTAAAFAPPVIALCSNNMLSNHHCTSTRTATHLPTLSQSQTLFSPIIEASPSPLFPSILTSTDSIPEYEAANAFQDTVTLSDLTSDPFLQTAFALTGLIIAALFVAKSIVTQMDDAVEKTALDFDRVMKLKYPKKWGDFIEEEEMLVGVVDREQREGDRIQRIVEEMERLTKEEPEFFERVMRDVERKI